MMRVLSTGQCVPRRLSGQRSQRSTRAFTLIELLVVISVIALLVSMLLPSLSRAKILAKRTTCMNNIKGIGAAAAMYQVDYGDYVPVCWANLDASYANPWKSWRSNLLPYLPYRVFNCPTATKPELFTTADDVTGQQHSGTANLGSLVCRQF